MAPPALLRGGYGVLQPPEARGIAPQPAAHALHHLRHLPRPRLNPVKRKANTTARLPQAARGGVQVPHARNRTVPRQVKNGAIPCPALPDLAGAPNPLPHVLHTPHLTVQPREEIGARIVTAPRADGARQAAARVRTPAPAGSTGTARRA